MANTILQKSRQDDATVPGATALKVGELAVNTFDGRVYLGTDLSGSASRAAGGAATASTWVGAPILDEDNFSSDSATSLATQQSIKAYIDSNAGTGDVTGVTITTDSGGGSAASDTAGSADFTLQGGAGIDVTNSGTTITVDGETASATNAGIVELATTAETTTGTDAARAVTPDGLKDGYQGSTNVTTLGTIATGVWNGTAIASAYIAGDAITGAKIADDAIDSEHYTDGSIDTAHLAADAVTGAKIADDAIDSEHITDGSVDNAHLAGSIANAKLANSAITVGGTATSLGGTVTGAHIAAALNSDLGGNFTIGNQSDDTCTITGNLTVGGTTTTTQSIAVGVSDTIIFEGSSDNSNETTLTVTNPTADRTITLPDVTGTVITTGDTATVTATMLAANSVDSSELVDGGIDTSHLSADCVTGAKIADDAIDSEHLADGSVDNAHLAGSIANAKLANSTISGVSLGSNLNALTVDDSSIELNSGTTFNGSAARTISIKDSGVTNAMLAGSIANSKLSNSAISIAGSSTSLGGSISAATIAAAIDSETMTLTNTTINGGAYTT